MFLFYLYKFFAPQEKSEGRANNLNLRLGCDGMDKQYQLEENFVSLSLVVEIRAKEHH